MLIHSRSRRACSRRALDTDRGRTWTRGHSSGLAFCVYDCIMEHIPTHIHPASVQHATHTRGTVARTRNTQAARGHGRCAANAQRINMDKSEVGRTLSSTPAAPRTWSTNRAPIRQSRGAPCWCGTRPARRSKQRKLADPRQLIRQIRSALSASAPRASAWTGAARRVNQISSDTFLL